MQVLERIDNQRTWSIIGHSMLILIDSILIWGAIGFLQMRFTGCQATYDDQFHFRLCQKWLMLGMLGCLGTMAIVVVINSVLITKISRKVSLLTLVTAGLLAIAFLMRYRF